MAAVPSQNLNNVMGVCDKSAMLVFKIEIDLRLAINNIAYNYNSHLDSPTTNVNALHTI